MNNKQLVFGVIFCFFISMLFLLVIIWEIKKSIDFDEKMRSVQESTKQITIDDNRDFSIYETRIGDDAREMILVPEGVFTRGSDSGGFDEKPQQEIYLDAFYVDKYEVSVEDYNKFRRAANYIEPSVPFFQGDHNILKTPNFPVVGVSWYDAVEFCNKLSAKEQFAPFYKLENIERKDGSIKTAKVTVAMRRVILAFIFVLLSVGLIKKKFGCT